jgi:nitroimidazol reductase NimA-like FMN-containing flavoprotein (pyridoxamine 5'-phosphate oxidase superfamily)
MAGYGGGGRAKSAGSTPRTRVRRLPPRGHYDRATIDAILDEALVSHLGFAVDGQPYVIPTLHARLGDHVYVHGSAASRALEQLASGIPACLTVTLVDGIVLARSIFNHSINYRSVVVLGSAVEIDEPDEKLAALAAFSERILPGRWDEVRPPTRKELKATSILRLPLDEASAKVRSGPPGDDEPDYAIPVWAGVIPTALVQGTPVADPKLAFDLPAPKWNGLPKKVK